MVFLGLRLLSASFSSSSPSTVKIRHPRVDKRKPSSSSSRSETWWGSPSQLLSSNVNSIFSVSSAFSFTSDTLASLSTFSILHCAHLLLAASLLVNSLNWLPMWSFQSPMPMATWKNLTTIKGKSKCWKSLQNHQLTCTSAWKDRNCRCDMEWSGAWSLGGIHFVETRNPCWLDKRL